MIKPNRLHPKGLLLANVRREGREVQRLFAEAYAHGALVAGIGSVEIHDDAYNYRHELLPDLVAMVLVDAKYPTLKSLRKVLKASREHPSYEKALKLL